MSEAQFRIVSSAYDWGPPPTLTACFPTLEEARAAARAYVEERRAERESRAFERVLVEETRPDGAFVNHAL